MRVLAFKAFLLFYGMVFGQDEWLFLGPGEGSSQPAVISLPLGGETCNLAIDRLPDLLDREGATAALVEGLVTVCNTAKDHMTHCFSLNETLGTWNELIEPLPLSGDDAVGSQAISLPNGDMLIFSYDTTYIYSIEHKTWTEGPKMPVPVGEVDFILAHVVGRRFGLHDFEGISGETEHGFGVWFSSGCGTDKLERDSAAHLGGAFSEGSVSST